MGNFNVAFSYLSLEKAATVLGVSSEDLIHAGAFNQVQICVNIFGRASGVTMHRIDVSGLGEGSAINAETSGHDQTYCAWVDRLKRNDMPDGVYELTQDDLRIFERPQIEIVELSEAYKSNELGLFEVEFDPLVEISRSDLVMLATEVERIHKTGILHGAALDKPLGNRERRTLLTIIAVLCKEAGIDHTTHSKAAGLIDGTAARMGVSIGESTIEEHLKKIPDVLASRMK